jgi:glycopeptide antibiotics resistance protein
MEKSKGKAATFMLLALFMIYIIALFMMTLFKDPNLDLGARRLNLIPFATIAGYLRNVARGNIIVGIPNLLGNLIMFFPLGYLTAVLSPKMRKLSAIFILALVFSAAIESFQFLLACGSADVDDVILNTLGAMAGLGVCALISKFWEPKKHAILISALTVAITCAGFYARNGFRFLIAFPAPAETRIDDFRMLPELAEHPENSDGGFPCSNLNSSPSVTIGLENK